MDLITKEFPQIDRTNGGMTEQQVERMVELLLNRKDPTVEGPGEDTCLNDLGGSPWVELLYCRPPWDLPHSSESHSGHGSSVHMDRN